MVAQRVIGLWTPSDAPRTTVPRPKDRKLETSPRLHDAVNEGLHQKWSPEQISKRLKADHPDDPEMRVSHETIYECLYLQARGALRTALKIALRQGRHGGSPGPGRPPPGERLRTW